MSDLEGTTIGHYRIDNLIGAGGMGTVYKAYDLNLERAVALKLMHPQIASQPEFRERLKTEAQTAANLDHPSIVRIYNFGETDDGLLYVAMEFVKDGSLRDHLQRVGARRAYLDIPLALQISIQIADALDAAHRAGVIHRDVKPGNMILKRLDRAEEAGFAPFRAVLTDFGLVQVINAKQRVTQAGITMGTPIYMSPEQCEGQPLDGRSDLYSLGVVLYEMLAGRPPFAFGSLSEAVATHVKAIYPPNVREMRSEVPPLLDALLSRALAKDPLDRFATGKEMADALRTAYFSVSDTPTRYWHNAALEDEGELTLTAPEGVWELMIRTAGHTESDSYPLTNAQYALGRGPDNDLVLASDAVSRHHARLEHTPSGWIIRALSSINGTFLNGRRLRPDEPVKIEPDEPVRLGPYEMWLNRTDTPLIEPHPSEPVQFTQPFIPLPETPPTLDTTIPPQPRPMHDSGAMRVDNTAHDSGPPQVPAPEPDEVFGVYLSPETETTEPGQPAEYIVEVLNRTPIDDRIRLNILGVPPEWVIQPRRFTPVPAGERVELSFKLNPPRDAATGGGRHRFRVELVAQRHPNVKPAVSGNLVIGTFESFDVEMTPREIDLPGTVQVRIRNQGNTQAEYSIVARDPQGDLKITGERGRLRLEPGQEAQVELAIEPRVRQQLFAPPTDVPFEVEARSTSGGVYTLGGVATAPNTTLALIGPILAALLSFTCLLSLLLGATNLFDRRNTTVIPTQITNQVDGSLPTVTSVFIAGPTPLVAVLDDTPTPLPTDAVFTNPNDFDDDGLSNAQERALGTFQDDPDSDDDGLTDGEEVNRYATEPTSADSDGDTLSDRDEVVLFNTDPRKRDTDGDGIDDPTEIANGTDPLQPGIVDPGVGVTPTPFVVLPTNTPTLLPQVTTPMEPGTATPTLILIAPTETPVTPIATDTPIVSTVEPLVTKTPTPTVIVVITATATTIPAVTETPIVAVTETPTDVPTEIPTPTNVPLDTPEPLPTQSVACAEFTPQLDGRIFSEEWGGPLSSNVLSNNINRVYDVFVVKDSTALYVAFEVSDQTVEIEDYVRIYVDTAGDGSDPDSADRYFEFHSDGTISVAFGIGTNTDGNGWTLTAADDGIEVVALQDEFGWIVEAKIPFTEQLPEMNDVLGIMVQALFAGEGLSTWPDNAAFDELDSWQRVNNSATCEPTE